MLTFAQAQLAGIEASVKWGEALETLHCAEGRRAKTALGSAPRGKAELPSRNEAVKAAGVLLTQLSSICRIITVESFDELARWRASISNDLPSGVVPRSATYLLGFSEVRAAHPRHPSRFPPLPAAFRHPKSAALPPPPASLAGAPPLGRTDPPRHSGHR